VRDPRGRGGTGIRDLISRRSFLFAAAGLALSPLAAPALSARRRLLAAAPGGVSPELEAALANSPYVYLSPLRKDGSESSCHGEVWFAWLDGAVVMICATTSWKARAVARGLERARLWVGDYGRWKAIGIQNNAFRSGPSFLARASASRDRALLDRLLAAYDGKYPAEIGKWRERMRSSFEDGSRVLLRYVPEPAART
jgi:hypothetical protein